MLIQGNFQEKPIINHGSAKGQKKHNLTPHDPRAFSGGIKSALTGGSGGSCDHAGLVEQLHLRMDHEI
jgi:hypothetical protein